MSRAAFQEAFAVKQEISGLKQENSGLRRDLRAKDDKRSSLQEQLLEVTKGEVSCSHVMSEGY